MRSVPYSKFTENIAALIGVEQANLQASETAILNTFFNKNIKYAWMQSNWIDLCPYGDYVTANNLLTFPNTFSNAVWVKNNMTVDDNSVANAISGEETAATFTTTGADAYIYQLFTPISTYQNYFGVWMRGSVNSQVPIQVLRQSDGLLVATSTFTLSNVWQFCLLPFNPVDLTQHRVQIGGSNILSSGLNFFVWQASAVDQYAITGGIIIPYTAPGGPQIDIPITLWKDAPFNPQPPRRVGYRLIDKGIKVNDQATNFIITNNFVLTTNTATVPIPVYYLYYRKRCPDYAASDYSASATYVIDDQIYFTAADGTSDYWKCLATTSAGESPTTTPSKWEKLEVPYMFLDYAVYSSYADWLTIEGQAGKALAMKGVAEELLTKELERQELQMGVTMPTRYSTHVTSQAFY